MLTRLRPVLHVVGERRAQAEIVERGRSQLPDELVDVAIDLLGHRFERLDLAAQIGRSAAGVLERADAASERRQLFTELIVHLARDAPALVLLREDEPREQLGARALGFGLPAFGEIEVRADDAHDRPARLAPDWKPRERTWT